MVKKNSHVEADMYCFELLAHARIINIKLTSCYVEFNVTKKNDNKFVGSYLRYAYNHVLLEKTSCLYQIHCLTCLKVRIYRACALSSPVTFLTGDQVHKSDLTKSLLWLCHIEIWVRD